MKFIVFFSILALTLSCNADSTLAKKTLPVKKEETAVKNETLKADVKKEDCDDKAKKPIEIKEDSISLTGNTGCSLDEVKP